MSKVFTFSIGTHKSRRWFFFNNYPDGFSFGFNIPKIFGLSFHLEWTLYISTIR